MSELLPILFGLVLGILGMLGLKRLSRTDTPAQDAPTLEPPPPTTHMGETADLDAEIDPPAPTIADHVKWADAAREDDE